MEACGYHVGIRTDSDVLMRRLQSFFARHRVSGSGPSDDFTISVERDLPDGVRLLPQLLHGRCPLLRSRSFDRLLHRLDLTLGLLGESLAAGLVQIVGMAAISKGQSVSLVPTGLIEKATAFEQLIANNGGRIIEEVATFIDLAAQEVVVAPGLTEASADAGGDDGITARPGRYAIRSAYWSVHDVEEDERRSVGVVRIMRRISKLGELHPQQVLDGAAELSRLFRPTPVDARASDLSAVLESLTG